MRLLKHVNFLQKRGRLKRGWGLPRKPDFAVEQSESQTVCTMVRARDGLLQLLPRRRRRDREGEVASVSRRPRRPGESEELSGLEKAETLELENLPPGLRPPGPEQLRLPSRARRPVM